MKNPKNTLPKEFADLAPFVEKWARPTEAERNRVRLASPMDEIQEFYDVMAPRMDDVLEYLSRFPAAEVPEEALALCCLGCAFMEASQAIERFGQPDVPDSFPADRVRIEENERFGLK